MATTYLHPGLYIEEVPGPHTIQGAPTSVAAFIGLTEASSAATAEPNVPTLVASWNDYQKQFGSLAWNAYLPWAVFEFFAEGGAMAYVVRVADGKLPAAPPLQMTPSPITIAPASKGSWSGAIGIVITNPMVNGTSITTVVNVYVVAALPSSTSTLANDLIWAYINHNSFPVVPDPSGTTKSPKPPLQVLESFTGITTAQAMFDQINNGSMFIRAGVKQGTVLPLDPSTPLPKASTSVQTFNPSGNNNPPDFQSAYIGLKSIQGISLIAIPDITSCVDTKGSSDWGAQQGQTNLALKFCEDQQNLFYVADPPFGLDVQEIVNYKTGQKPQNNGNGTYVAVNSDRGALYHPWIYVSNPASGTSVPVPPSGAALGRYASTDSNVGVWKSPAGTVDGLMQSVMAVDDTQLITDTLQEQLNPLGINAIRNIVNYGNLIYGARTLSMGGDWTYLSIRRLFIFVEQSLRNSLQWVVFEPNDSRLWAKVTRDVSAFLTMLWHQGALFGDTASQAFFVVCDTSNNPPEERALGQLHIDVGMAPVYPAEFVIIRVSQKTANTGSGA